MAHSKNPPIAPKIYASEDKEQEALIAWARLHPILKGLLYSIPNGGTRNPAEAAKLKRTGVLAGVSDLHLPYPSNGYHGLWIEMKRVQGGRLQKAQSEWLDKMNQLGFLAVECRGWDMAKKIIEDYLR